MKQINESIDVKKIEKGYSNRNTNITHRKGEIGMMEFEKEPTQDKVDGIKDLGQLKKNLPPGKWVLFRTLMLTYINGFEAGLTAGQDARICK